MDSQERKLTLIGRIDRSVDLRREGVYPIFWRIKRQVREAVQACYGDRARDVLEQPFQAILFNQNLREKGIFGAVLIGPGSHHWACSIQNDDVNYPLKIELQPFCDTSRLIGIDFKTVPPTYHPSVDQRQARQIFSHRINVADRMSIETHFPIDVTANFPPTAETEVPISSCIAVALTPTLMQRMSGTGRSPQFLLVTGLRHPPPTRS